MLRLILLSIFLVNFAMAFNVKSLLTYTFDGNVNYDISKAKEIYFKNKCQACHGDNGEKTDFDKRAIKDLSPAEIKASLKNYANGFYKKNSNDDIQMGIYARKLSDDDMNHIIAYLKGENFAIELNQKDLLEEEPKQKTKHGTFLK